MGWAAKDHQVCLAHLLRDIQYAIDAGDDAFAPGMKALLKRAMRIGRRRPALADATLAAYHARLQTRLDALLTIVPDTKAGQKLQRIIKRFRQNLFVFVTNRAVPPTNNGSEQALRPCVVFRKVTNCFRSQWGAHLYADVRSVLETARRRRHRHPSALSASPSTACRYPWTRKIPVRQGVSNYHRSMVTSSMFLAVISRSQVHPT